MVFLLGKQANILFHKEEVGIKKTQTESTDQLMLNVSS